MPPIDCAIAPNTAPASQARVVAPYAHTLWDAAMGEGVALSALQLALGQSAIGEADVPLPAYLRMLDTACEAVGPDFGWRMGRYVKPTTYGVNGILLLACPTLGEALQQVLRFESLVHDLGRSSLVLEGDHATYTWRNDCADHVAAGPLAESVFSGILTCATWLVGRPLGAHSVNFAHAAAPGSARTVQAMGQAQVRWGAACNSVVFSAPFLALPIQQANTALLPLLQQHADSLLQARHPREVPIVAQVRQSISGRLGQGPVKLADVAADLLLSTRTLQRRLTDAGVAFQQLLDTTRLELARHYLANTAMPVAQVGYLLGFQDAPAFHHAFKTWQGQGPGQYRTGVRGR